MSLVDNECGSTDEYDANAYMIDINAVHLKSVRTQCLLTECLTQSEIRFTENKLVKLFGKQAVERQLAVLNHQRILPSPQLEKWLSIVGLSDSLAEAIGNKIDNNFDTLLSLNQDQLDELLIDASEEDARKMNAATNNLKLFIEKLKLNDPTANELDLHWDSWDKERELENKIEEENQLQSSQFNSNLNNLNNLNSNLSNENQTNSPSPLDESKRLFVNSQEQLDIETPNCTSNSSSREFNNRISPSTTPPYYKTNQVGYTNQKFKVNLDYNLNMPKSKSHEEQLTNKIELKERNPELFENLNFRRKRLESEPCAGTKLNNYSSRSPPIASPDNNLKNATSDSCFDDQSSTSLTNSYNNITVPRSPRTQGMLHAIKHRFVNRIRPKTVICNLCEKPMMFGFKCKEKKCKYRCHKECASKVPPSCGLPPELFTIFKETFQNSNSRSPISSVSCNQPPPTPLAKLNKKNKFKTNIKKSSPDSSNASSRNSSAPPSPIQPNTMNTPAIDTTYTTTNNSSIMASGTFAFNENNHMDNNKLMVDDENDLNDNQQIVNKNLNILSSQDSQSSDFIDFQDDDDTRPWPRQNSLTMREWSIPWDEIVREKEIGAGRFGTVFKGSWHGDVAIKMFNVENSLDDKKTIEAFRTEIATFRKTRHENLVLFMGACMNPPHLAIVTSYCKGFSLHTHIYERNEKFPLAKAINISRQISQGMGYLHARGIIHKDLRTKNVFFDNSNSKVIISDFGFFSLTKLCCSNDKTRNRLKIPTGWLYYLAPELMKVIRAEADNEDDLPFSNATDMFSFGTIWHELIFSRPPFDGVRHEILIWQVGKGIKQSLVNMQASKEVKDVVMLCWAFKPTDRPDFSKLAEILINLPKKRSLMRSPSHPTHLITSNVY